MNNQWTWSISHQRDKGSWLTLYKASGWSLWKIRFLSILHIFDNIPPYSLSYRLCSWAMGREDNLWEQVAEIPLNGEQVNEINRSIEKDYEEDE